MEQLRNILSRSVLNCLVTKPTSGSLVLDTSCFPVCRRHGPCTTGTGRSKCLQVSASLAMVDLLPSVVAMSAAACYPKSVP